VHMEVIRFARDGYTVIFIGHRNHDEAVGTVGEAPGSILVVEGPQDVDRLSIRDESKLAYVTQTTLSLHDASQTIAAIKRRWPQVVSPPKEDICYATTNRQGAVSALSSEADLVLVVGSSNSSNSRRLVETANAAGKPANLIDDASQLEARWFEGMGTVLVTAGASAPEHLVQLLVEQLQARYAAEVETRTLVDEKVFFVPPRSLRSLPIAGQDAIPA